MTAVERGGIQHFMYVDFVITLIPEWIAGRRFWTYLTGTALMAAGAAITLDRTARLAASLLGVMIFAFFLLVHILSPCAVLPTAHLKSATYVLKYHTEL